MKLEVHIDPALAETRVEVYAPARTPEVDALLDRLTAEESPLLGFRTDGTAVPLDLDNVLRFYGEDKDVRAQTAEAVYTVLYENTPPKVAIDALFERTLKEEFM